MISYSDHLCKAKCRLVLWDAGVDCYGNVELTVNVTFRLLPVKKDIIIEKKLPVISWDFEIYNPVALDLYL